jgi:hypothetical protein
VGEYKKWNVKKKIQKKDGTNCSIITARVLAAERPTLDLSVCLETPGTRFRAGSVLH